MKYIDIENCVGCRSCIAVCEKEAIKLDDKDVEWKETVGAVIIATGFKPIDPKELELIYRLRRVLSELNPVEAIELLKNRLSKTRTNAEFLMTMNLD